MAPSRDTASTSTTSTSTTSTAAAVGKPLKKLNFFEDFMLGGIAAAISKTTAAPLERMKLLLQNQHEMVKSGRLATPYTGVVDCFR